LEALISFFPTPGEGAVAALDWPTKDRQILAKRVSTKRIKLWSSRRALNLVCNMTCVHNACLQSHKYNVDNKLYRYVEPLQPATKEEIIRAQQTFCDEAKDTASMSSYQPGASPAKKPEGGNSPATVSSAAATPEGPRKRSAAAPAPAAAAHSPAREAGEQKTSAQRARTPAVKQKAKSSHNVLSILMCVLLLILAVLIFRKFNKTNIL